MELNDKIISVIKSCKTPEQLESCRNWIYNLSFNYYLNKETLTNFNILIIEQYNLMIGK